MLKIKIIIIFSISIILFVSCKQEKKYPDDYYTIKDNYYVCIDDKIEIISHDNFYKNNVPNAPVLTYFSLGNTYRTTLKLQNGLKLRYYISWLEPGEGNVTGMGLTINHIEDWDNIVKNEIRNKWLVKNTVIESCENSYIGTFNNKKWTRPHYHLDWILSRKRNVAYILDLNGINKENRPYAENVLRDACYCMGKTIDEYYKKHEEKPQKEK